MYYLERKNKKDKLKEVGEFEGIKATPKVNKSSVKIGSVIICDKYLRNKYAIRQLNKKFKTMYKKIYDFLNSDDDSETGIKACLGEIEKTKQAIFNSYKEDLKRKEYKEFLAKIVLTENEFREQYKEREFYNNMLREAYKRINNPLIEEEVRGKSR